MPNYTVTIKIPNAGNREIAYSIDLTDSYEDHPEDYFRSPENRFQLCQTIQNQSARQLSPEQLTRVIQEWIEEIKQGRRQITMVLDLPSQGISSSNPTITNDINSVTSPFSQKLLSPPPKPKNPIPLNSKMTNPSTQKTLSSKTSDSVSKETDKTDKTTDTPTIFFESATNEIDI